MANSGLRGKGDAKKAASPPHPGLELPDGYVKPKPAGKQNKRKKKNNTGAPQNIKQGVNAPTSRAVNQNRKTSAAPTYLRPIMAPIKTTPTAADKAAVQKLSQKDELLGKLSGPVRFIEDDTSAICICDPRIGFNKARYDLARAKKYEPEQLIALKADVRIPAERENRHSPKFWSLQGLPQTICDEFPDGYAPKTHEEASAVLKHYPHVMLTTRGPLTSWGVLAFASKPDIDAPENAFLRVLRQVELGHKILEELASNYFAMANLASTCVTAFRIIDEILTDRWNMTKGIFNSCEYTPEEIEQGVAGEATSDTTNGVSSRGVSNFLIVSPTHEILDEGRGFKYRRPLSAKTEVLNTMKFFRALNNVGNNIQYLQLHRMGNLDIVLLKAMLPMLPNLKTLGVLQCPLITFFETKLLLLAIKDHQEKHGAVKLDFFPRYHHGSPKEGRLGSYGLSWMDTNKPIKTAIGARLIFSYLPLALEIGQDHWFELSSSYCQFLEKLPLPDYFVPRVLNVVLRADKLKTYLIDDTPTFIKHMFNMCGAVLGDGAFLTGDEMIHETQYKAERYQVWTEKWHCNICNQDMPAFFFRRDARCDACALRPRIADEIDHYKVEKRDIAESLYKHCGAKLGEDIVDLRENFDFGKIGFLQTADLTRIIDGAVKRAVQMDRLRALTTSVLQYVDRAEIHLLPPVGQTLAKVTRDRDWNDRQFVLKIDEGDLRGFGDRYLKAEDWDAMRSTRARKLEKAKTYCLIKKLPTDEEYLRKVIRCTPADDWLKLRRTVDGRYSDDFY